MSKSYQTRLVRTVAAAAIASALGFAAAPAFADDAAAAPAAAPTPDFKATGSVELASQYRFRGVAQSNNQPVIQGALTISHKSGFYVATWGSSASSSNPNQAANIGGTEIDLFGGWTGALGKSGVTFDGGFYSYLYPGATAGEFYEVYSSLSKALGPVTGKVGVNYALKQHNLKAFTTAAHDNTYLYAELGGAIPKTPLTVHSHLGYSAGALEYTRDNLDYTVGVSYAWQNLTFDVSAVGTDITHADATKATKFAAGTYPFVYNSADEIYRAGKAVAVVSLTASF